MATDEQDMLQRLDDARDGLQQILDTGLEPRDLSDPDKLRLEAAMHDMRDYKRGVYDRTEVQDDLRRIASRLEEYEIGVTTKDDDGN